MSSKTNKLKLIKYLTNTAFPLDPNESIQVNQMRDSSSWEHDTITYNSVWQGGEIVPLVLRSYRSGLTYWQTNDPHKTDRVWAVLRRLRLDSFPSPRPMAKAEVENQRYLIWHKDAGENWRTRSENIGEAAKPLVPQLAELLARLHSLNHNGLNDEPLYQATVAGTLVRMLLWSREIGSEDLRQAVARLKPAVREMRTWRPHLIHGNPHLGNVLVVDGQISALINWEHAAIGDPRWDVMTAAHWLRIHNGAQNEALADQLVNWYETFTSKTIDHRPAWWALISTRRWALKAWLAHAIEHEHVTLTDSPWIEDIAEAKALAFEDLQAAGL